MTTESTENTTSIFGIQPSLVEVAKKMRDRQLEEVDRQRRDAEVAESKRLEESKQVFLDFLDKYAGDILRQLDFSTSHPVIENDTSNWFYDFRVAHTVITLVTPENLHNGHCSIGVSVKGGYFGYMERKWIDKENLSDFLLSLVGKIVEQYQEYRFLAADLETYNLNLKTAAQKFLVEATECDIWTWPDRATLNLYKIIWTKGGCCSSDTEFGWSLYDHPDGDGYFYLLTPTNSINSRKLKVTPSAIELFSIVRLEDVPVELIVAIRPEYEVAIASEISIRETTWSEDEILDYKRGLEYTDLDDLEGEDDIHIVFPEHLPKYHLSEYYSQIPDLIVFKKHQVYLGQVPCLEIRLAVEAIACENVSAK
jgi:hypothetical protein